MQVTYLYITDEYTLYYTNFICSLRLTCNSSGKRKAHFTQITKTLYLKVFTSQTALNIWCTLINLYRMVDVRFRNSKSCTIWQWRTYIRYGFTINVHVFCLSCLLGCYQIMQLSDLEKIFIGQFLWLSVGNSIKDLYFQNNYIHCISGFKVSLLNWLTYDKRFSIFVG